MVVIPEEQNKEGYALYVKENGMLCNDEWCIVHKDTGIVRHYLSHQIRIQVNATYGIKKA